MSPVIDCSTDAGRDAGIAAAVTAVRSGRLVVLPTDTVYGIGADAFDSEAVTTLLEAKGRGRHMPPAVLVAEKRTVDGLAIDVPDYARALIDAYWPGPLTLILKAQPSLRWDLGDTNGTVGLRMPDDQLALSVLSQTGPMAVSSANRTGAPPATTVTQAAAMLGPSVEVYLDGGPSPGTVASTIVDCTREAPVVLRVGGIPADEVARAAEAAEAGSDAGSHAGAADAGSDAEAADEVPVTVVESGQEPSHIDDGSGKASAADNPDS